MQQDTQNTDTAVLDAVQQKLLETTGAVSSNKSEIDKLIGESIAGLEKGQTARETGVKAEAERARIETREAGGSKLTSALEERRGFATNTALIRQIEESTQKSLRDLDLREQQALVSGQVETATQISNLKMNQLQFGIQSQQQAFENLLAGAGLELQLNAQKQSQKQFLDSMSFNQKQFEFTKQSKMVDLATEFGVTIDENETLESLVKKVQPFAKEERKAKLASLLKDTEADDSELNFDSELTRRIVNDSEEPIAAANAILADQTRLCIKVTKEDYNKAISKAQEISDAWRTKQEKDKAESQGKGVGGFLNSFMESVRKQREGKRSKSDKSISGGTTFGGLGESFEQDPIFSFFNSLLE